MSWLLPLGFLGLIGLAVLLLIYLIKPNYQNKLVSSTFVWKLSLKYQKKRIPISKLKNLIILFLQILILTLCAFILAGPIIMEEVRESDEVVIILDASASMRATDADGITRFDRAVEDARDVVGKTFNGGGRVSLILADKDADFMAHRATSEYRYDLDDKLQALVDDDACTYGSADIDGAINLANSIVQTVPDTHVIMYTSTRYENHGSVDVRTIVDEVDDWNVAILDLRVEKTVENTYTFYVDLACYGRDMQATLELTLNNVNSKNEQLTYLLSTDPVKSEPIRLINNRTTTVTIPTNVAVPRGKDGAVPVFSFDEVTATVRADDSLLDDNTFSLYGNILPVMNIQYASSRPNSFFAAAFMSLQSALQNRWTVNFREVQLTDQNVGSEDKIATKGYDLYVFEESAIPQTLPTDGVVFFVNPRYLPMGVDFGLSSAVTVDRTPLDSGEEHPITKNVFAGNMEVTRYSSIMFNTAAASSDYTPLLYCRNAPVMVCKNTPISKIVALSFSMNYSTAAMSYDFPRLMFNIVNFYLPSTLDKNVYEVNDSVTLRARGEKLKVDGPGISEEYAEFPLTLALTRIGTYTATQNPKPGVTVVDKFFARIPKYESNIMRIEPVLKNQVEPYKRDPNIDDLCVYFAAVLVAFIVLERFLQSRTMS